MTGRCPLENEELVKLLDEANDCVLCCLNEEQTAKRPKYGAINYLQDLHQRMRDAIKAIAHPEIPLDK